jgi:hypothetical protein
VFPLSWLLTGEGDGPSLIDEIPLTIDLLDLMEMRVLRTRFAQSGENWGRLKSGCAQDLH